MESIRLFARNGEAVRQALEGGEFTHLDTASKRSRTNSCSLPSRADCSSNGPRAFPIRALGPRSVVR